MRKHRLLGRQPGGSGRKWAWERDLFHFLPSGTNYNELFEAQPPPLKMEKWFFSGISSMGSGVRLPGVES